MVEAEGKAVLPHNTHSEAAKTGKLAKLETQGQSQQLPNQPLPKQCPQCGLSLDNLSVVQPCTTDRIRSLWRDHRFSKQAKDFLRFLIEKNIDGTSYSKPHDNLEPYDDFPYETKHVGSKEVNGKWIVGVETDFYSKGVSLIGFISANRNNLVDVHLFNSSLTGVLCTHNVALRNSLNRTIHRLWHWNIICRFYFPTMYGPKYYYFITEKGRQVFHAKCCFQREQHLEQKQTALMVRQ